MTLLHREGPVADGPSIRNGDEENQLLSFGVAGGIDGDDDASSTCSSQPSEILSSSPYRWVMLALFFVANLSNCMIWMAAAATQKTTKEFFGVSDQVVNYATIIFPAGYLWAGPVATWFVETRGFNMGFRVGAFLNGLGGIIRTLSVILPGHHFFFIFIGNFVASAATPVLLGCPTMLAGSWFSEKERTIATSIMSIADPLGMASSFALALITESPGNIPRFNLIIGGLAAVSMLLALTMSRASPAPPSKTAHVSEDEITAKKVLLSCKKIFRIPAFWVVFLVYGTSQGAFFSLVSVLKEVMVGLEYSNTEINTCGMAMLLTSIPANLTAGFLVDRFRAYKFSMNLALLITALAAGSLTFMLASGVHSFIGFLGITIILGLFFSSVAPVALELSVEISYPISESISGGILQYSSQVCETGFTLIASSMLNPQTHTLNKAVYMFTGVFGLGFVCFFFFFQPPFFKKGRYERLLRELAPKVHRSRSALSAEGGLSSVPSWVKSAEFVGAYEGVNGGSNPDLDLLVSGGLAKSDFLGVLGPEGEDSGDNNPPPPLHWEVDMVVESQSVPAEELPLLLPINQSDTTASVTVGPLSGILSASMPTQYGSSGNVDALEPGDRADQGS